MPHQLLWMLWFDEKSNISNIQVSCLDGDHKIELIDKYCYGLSYNAHIDRHISQAF